MMFVFMVGFGIYDIGWLVAAAVAVISGLACVACGWCAVAIAPSPANAIRAMSMAAP